jgi:hypothetical protein
MKTRWQLSLLLVICLHVVLLFQPVHPDEAHFLTITRDIHLGYMPYSTLFDNKPPGIYYFLGMVYPWFGQSVWGYRLFYVAINLGLGLVMIKILAKKTDVHFAGQILTLTLLLMAMFHGTYALTEPPLVLLVATGWLIILKTPRTFLPWLMAGIVGGGAFWFKQTAVSFWAFLLYRSFGLPGKIKSIGITGLIVGIITSMGLGGLLLLNGIQNPLAWQAIVGVNLNEYTPILNYESIVFWAGHIILPLTGIFWVVWRNRRRLMTSPLTVQSLIYFGLTLPWVVYRPYHHYWVLMVPVFVIIFGELLTFKKDEFLIWVNVMFVIVVYSLYSLFYGIPQATAQKEYYFKKQECDPSASLDYFFNVCDSVSIHNDGGIVKPAP